MAYTSDSAADRLAAVRQAIADCLASQSYGTRGRTQTRARLAELRELERDLQEEVAAAAHGGAINSLGRLTR